MTYNVLALDTGGSPIQWITPEEAIHYYATDKVVWDLGEAMFVYRGGISRMTGDRSQLASKPIIALSGSEISTGKYNKVTIPLRSNSLLFRRDHNMCAYCGTVHATTHKLTRDHIMPWSRGGKNVWTNVVSACKSCNVRKDNKTPEEAGMKLLYVPYVPCRWEHFILQNRNILADQMSYLMAKLPKHSRHLVS